MKPKSVTILALSLLFLAVFLFVSHHMRVKRVERETAIQAAKTQFLMLPANRGASIDSTSINNDTLFYFRKDSFIGKSVITTE